MRSWLPRRCQHGMAGPSGHLRRLHGLRQRRPLLHHLRPRPLCRHSCLAGAASSIAISLTCSGNNRFRCGKLIHSFSQEKRTKLIQILCSDPNVARFAITCMVGTAWVRRPIACISCCMVMMTGSC